MEKDQYKKRINDISFLIQDFCAQKLNEDYGLLCEKLLLKLSRKRSKPLAAGSLEIWAAAIVNAIGSNNFLFDKATKPYVSKDELNDFFGTKKTSVSSKSSAISKEFGIWYYDPEFTLKENIRESPFSNFVMVDGIIMPVSSLPLHLQEMVKEARENGDDISFSTKS